MLRLSLFTKHIFKFTMSKPPSQATIFDKILNKEIPSSKVYEDELIYAFDDVNPQAPVHVLMIPKDKNGLSGISKAEEKNKEVLGHMMLKVNEIAKIKGIEEQGYRVVVNEGKNGQQTVPHLHLHVLGGRAMNWPPG